MVMHLQQVTTVCLICIKLKYEMCYITILIYLTAWYVCLLKHLIT